MLYGVLLTFRRPTALRHYLGALAEQTRRPDVLVLVDNDPGRSGRHALDAHLEGCARAGTPAAADRIEYLPQPENLGSAGGWAAGQRQVVAEADPHDWLVVLDDDDPPPDTTTLEELDRFAQRMVATDPATAAVGRTGTFFDPVKGRIRRLAQDDLDGPVRVDVLGCGHFPFYRVGVMQQEGPFLGDLFFGYVELEYGLRLREGGHRLYVDGDAVRARRQAEGRLDGPARVRSELTTSLRPWRVYCTTRNLVYLLRREHQDVAALRVVVRRGLGRPLAEAFARRRGTVDYLKAGLYGSAHGWRARLGRSVDPTADRFAVVRAPTAASSAADAADDADVARDR